MNVLFYLTPKCDCAYVEDDDTLRQALEKMENRRYSAVPLLNQNGNYVGTLTEGDLLWGIKNKYNLDLREAEHIPITDIERRRDYVPISVRSDMEDLSRIALNQNFVPVLDDGGKFIGIVTRKDIMKYFTDAINRIMQSGADSPARRELRESFTQRVS